MIHSLRLKSSLPITILFFTMLAQSCRLHRLWSTYPRKWKQKLEGWSSLLTSGRWMDFLKDWFHLTFLLLASSLFLLQFQPHSGIMFFNTFFWWIILPFLLNFSITSKLDFEFAYFFLNFWKPKVFKWPCLWSQSTCKYLNIQDFLNVLCRPLVSIWFLKTQTVYN